MFSRVLGKVADSQRLKHVVETAPVSRSVVRRFVAGDREDDAIAVTRELAGTGLLVTLDHLGEDTLDVQQAAATAEAYVSVLHRLATEGLASATEVSVKLSSVGQVLSIAGDGHKIALEHAMRICAAAKDAGTTVTFDMEDHTTTDSTLEIVRTVRRDFPWAGVAVQSYLRRTEGDCRDLLASGSRVRLVKGAYAEPESVAYQSRRDVDRAYVRCLKLLMAGDGYPMVATHDPRLVEIAGSLAVQTGRDPSSYEFQLLYGVRPEEQRRLADRGEQVRIYVPYGVQWYGYLMRRMAERPANAMVFLRSLTTKR
ncbi:MAG: proline dehydrogenase family protein [Streptosporangiales bacterium]|nr:proline dehydrogenase family protein [Streptosporangiales bacterium]MBO0889704.1 proline dehydrogenase family protein [Acidothermales bacterium]